MASWLGKPAEIKATTPPSPSCSVSPRITLSPTQYRCRTLGSPQFLSGETSREGLGVMRQKGNVVTAPWLWQVVASELISCANAKTHFPDSPAGANLTKAEGCPSWTLPSLS